MVFRRTRADICAPKIHTQLGHPGSKGDEGAHSRFKVAGITNATSGRAEWNTVGGLVRKLDLNQSILQLIMPVVLVCRVSQALSTNPWEE